MVKRLHPLPKYNNVMVVLDKEHVLSVVRTILAQLIGTTSSDIIGSWGVSKFYAIQIVKTFDEVEVSMAALVMQVNGFQFKGTVYVALDEGSDYYRIYGEKDGISKEYYSDVSFDELGDKLDSMIETGNMTEEEYQQQIDYYLQGL